MKTNKSESRHGNDGVELDNIDKNDPELLYKQILDMCDEELEFYAPEDALLDDPNPVEIDRETLLNDFAKNHIKRVTVMMQASIPSQEKINRLVRDFREAHREVRKLAASKLPGSQLHDLKKDLQKTLKEIGGAYIEAMRKDEIENNNTHVAAVIEDYDRELENALNIIKYTPRNKLYYLNERADEVSIMINKKLNAFAESLGNVLAWAKKTFTLENIVSTMDKLSTGISTTFDAITSWIGKKWNHLTNKNSGESEYIPPEQGGLSTKSLADRLANSETSEYRTEYDDKELSRYENTEEILKGLHLFDQFEHVRKHKGTPTEAASLDAIKWQTMAIDEDVTTRSTFND